MSELLKESLSIWRAGGPLMVPLSLLAFGLFFSQVRLLLRLRSLSPSTRLPLIDSTSSPARRTRSIPDEFSRERSRLLGPVDRRIRYYAILVGICPLLGLLGTVAGMTSTFEGIARPGPTNLSTEVAGGISEALVTTQAGLLVAIPGMILLALLRRGRDRVALLSFAEESQALQQQRRPAAAETAS